MKLHLQMRRMALELASIYWRSMHPTLPAAHNLWYQAKGIVIYDRAMVGRV